MREIEYDNPLKIFVEVEAVFTQEGMILPRKIVWEDGQRFDIDRVLDCKPCASLKAGGSGLRYTIVLCGEQRYIWLEGNRWFVEAKMP